MKDYVAHMIQEYAELVIRINKLEDFIYGNNGMNVHTNIENNKTQDQLFHNMSEYANKCMQLMSMRNYKHSLECRLNNEGIVYEGGEYLETVGEIVNRKEIQIKSDAPESEEESSEHKTNNYE